MNSSSTYKRVNVDIGESWGTFHRVGTTTILGKLVADGLGEALGRRAHVIHCGVIPAPTRRMTNKLQGDVILSWMKQDG
jgi:hypothetical protein